MTAPVQFLIAEDASLAVASQAHACGVCGRAAFVFLAQHGRSHCLTCAPAAGVPITGGPHEE